MDVLMRRIEAVKNKASKSDVDVWFLEELKDDVRLMIGLKDVYESRKVILLKKEFLKRQYHRDLMRLMTNTAKYTEDKR